MLDILILIFVLGGVFGGLRTGLIRQLVGLAGLVAAVVLGIILAEPVGAHVADLLRLPSGHDPVAGFVVVFVGVYLAALIASRFLMAVVRTLQLTGLNRLIGGLFGGIKSGLLVGALLMGLAVWDLPPTALRVNSTLYSPLVRVIHQVWDAVGDRVPGSLDRIEPPSSRRDANGQA